MQTQMCRLSRVASGGLSSSALLKRLRDVRRKAGIIEQKRQISL
jgi:hypothetical protein